MEGGGLVLCRIRGEGQKVEVDETLFACRKYNRGCVVREQWVVGGVCRETKECFVVPVRRRDAATLLRVIGRHVQPGSSIITDCWRGYRTEDLAAAGFAHFTVNHSVNFMDPDTGAHTQSVERFWGALKARNKRHRGTTRKHLPGYLCGFVWRYNRAEDEDLFEAFLLSIARVFPHD